MDAAMNHEAGTIDAEPGYVLDDVAILVDLDKAGSGDFVEHHAVRVDQHVFAARYASRKVRKNQVGPAKLCSELVSGSKVAANLPLLIADTRT